LLDDLVKDRKEADSPLMRDNTWDWYRTAPRTRLRKNGWIVFVNTRWHEDDPGDDGPKARCLPLTDRVRICIGSRKEARTWAGLSSLRRKSRQREVRLGQYSDPDPATIPSPVRGLIIVLTHGLMARERLRILSPS
jgi:hypothetical protein